jgi:hypothetical protein
MLRIRRRTTVTTQINALTGAQRFSADLTGLRNIIL